MKRICLVLIYIGIIPFIYGQNTKPTETKEGKEVTLMPQAHDWGVGIDASPFFQYVGNIFAQNGNQYVPGFAFTAQYPGSIYIKYKPSLKTTLRFILDIGVSYDEDKIPNDNNPDKPHQYITSALAVGGIFGFERNLSIVGRVNAFYGAQAGFKKIPYSTGTVTGKIEYNNEGDDDLDFTEEGGNSAQFVAGGFGGLEFYFLPRVALAGEVGVNLSAYLRNERFRKTGPQHTKEIVDNGGLGINLRPVASGNLSIFIYF
jgi:hypothetical protein